MPRLGWTCGSCVDKADHGYALDPGSLLLVNWRELGLSALWVVGLAIVLATLGFARFHGDRSNKTLLKEACRPRYLVAISGGLALAALGIGGSSQLWWEAGLWLVISLMLLMSSLSLVRSGAEGYVG